MRWWSMRSQSGLVRHDGALIGVRMGPDEAKDLRARLDALIYHLE
jgi:hypothetical protein